MKRTISCILAGIFLMQFAFWGNAGAAESVSVRDLGQYFGAEETATFVLYDHAKQQYQIYNLEQSNKRMSPCSTFKIYNALIGLDTGILAQEDHATLRKWDGTIYPFAVWNRDQTLATAMRDSVVWYYQDVAMRIGSERMQKYLDAFGYGNRDISGGQNTFWLSSSLQISAREQVDLLRKLYERQLPVAPQSVAVMLRDITLSDDGKTKLMGKTGTGDPGDALGIGWFVGCVEKDGNHYFFAASVQSKKGITGPQVKEITRKILTDMKILSLEKNE